MATAKNKRGAATRIKRADRKNISVGQAHPFYVQQHHRFHHRSRG